MAGAFSEDITAQLVSWGNPEGQITNSELELADSVLHHACMADFFHLRERTMLSRTDNTVGLWWQRKGSDTSTFPPAHLLCLQAIHQRFHRYVPRHNFLSGVHNGIYDRPSRSRDLTDAALLAHVDTSHPQDLPWRLLTPPSDIISVIASALWRKTSPRDSLIADLPPTMGTG